MEGMEAGNGRGGRRESREGEAVPRYVYLACDDPGNQCADCAFLRVLSVGYRSWFQEQCQRFLPLFLAPESVLDLPDCLVCGGRTGGRAFVEGSRFSLQKETGGRTYSGRSADLRHAGANSLEYPTEQYLDPEQKPV